MSIKKYFFHEDYKLIRSMHKNKIGLYTDIESTLSLTSELTAKINLIYFSPSMYIVFKNCACVIYTIF